MRAEAHRWGLSGRCGEFGRDLCALRLTAGESAAQGLDVAPYASVQNHYSVLTRGPETDGVFAACEQLGMAFVPFFPLESGLLTGKYRRGEERPVGARLTVWGDRAASFIDDDKLAVVERLIAWCESRGRSLLELAIGWHTSHPLVASVIAGATSPEQVDANVAASNWSLTSDDRAEVDAVIAG